MKLGLVLVVWVCVLRTLVCVQLLECKEINKFKKILLLQK